MASSDAKPFPIKNTAYRVTFPILDADGDLVTGATGLDSEVSKDGGTFADCTAEAAEIATSSGIYYLDLSSDEMNADTVAIIIKTSTSGAKTTPIVFYPVEATDIPVNVTAIGGDAQSGTDLKDFADAGYDPATNKVQGVVLADTCTALTGNTAQTGDSFARLGAPAGASVSADVAAVKGYVDDIGVAGAGLTAVPWNAAWDAEVQSECTDSLNAYDPPTNTELNTAHTTTNGLITTVDTVVDAIKVDTAAVLLDTGTDGVVLPQAQADKVWGTAVRTLSAAGVQAIWDALTSALTTAGSIGKKLADWVVGTIDTYTGNTKQTGDSFARLGAPAGASVSADVAAVKTDTAAILVDTGTTLEADLDAILADTNELETDWHNGGRLDVILDAAASAGDPWITALPGAYGAGTAGKIVGDNINAPISTIDTVVDAVKIVTDKVATALELDGAVYRYTANALEQAPSGGATVAQIADGVWDEAAADHVASGSTGKKLNDVTGGSPVNIEHDSTVIITDS